MFLLLFVLKNVAQPYFSRKCLLPAASSLICTQLK